MRKQAIKAHAAVALHAVKAAPRKAAVHVRRHALRHALRIAHNMIRKDVLIVFGVVAIMVILKHFVHRYEMAEHGLDNVEHATTVLEVIHILGRGE